MFWLLFSFYTVDVFSSHSSNIFSVAHRVCVLNILKNWTIHTCQDMYRWPCVILFSCFNFFDMKSAPKNNNNNNNTAYTSCKLCERYIYTQYTIKPSTAKLVFFSFFYFIYYSFFNIFLIHCTVWLLFARINNF